MVQPGASSSSRPPAEIFREVPPSTVSSDGRNPKPTSLLAWLCGAPRRRANDGTLSFPIGTRPDGAGPLQPHHMFLPGMRQSYRVLRGARARPRVAPQSALEDVVTLTFLFRAVIVGEDTFSAQVGQLASRRCLTGVSFGGIGFGMGGAPEVEHMH